MFIQFVMPLNSLRLVSTQKFKKILKTRATSAPKTTSKVSCHVIPSNISEFLEKVFWAVFSEVIPNTLTGWLQYLIPFSDQLFLLKISPPSDRPSSAYPSCLNMIWFVEERARTKGQICRRTGFIPVKYFSTDIKVNKFFSAFSPRFSDTVKRSDYFLDEINWIDR